MAGFDPDAYLRAKASFNPDKYLNGASQSFADKAKNAVQDFGAGAMEGASFGTATIDKQGNMAKAPAEDIGVPGSIMTSFGNAKKDFLDRNFSLNAKNIGKSVGGFLPLVFSEMLAGAPADALVAKFGMGPLQAAMNRMGMTMASYEGMRGAVKNTPPAETVGNMATGYAAGMPLGAAGYGAGKAVDYLTKDVPESMANQYLKTPAKIADSRMDKGQPSLGREYLDRTTTDSSVSKKQAYTNHLAERENNRMLIVNELRKADELARTPSTAGPAIEGTPQLEYKPTQTQNVAPNTQSYPWPNMETSVAKKEQIAGGKAVVPRGMKTPDPELLSVPAPRGLETPDPYAKEAQATGQGQHFGATTTGPDQSPASKGSKTTVAEREAQYSKSAAQKARDVFDSVRKENPGHPFTGIKKGGIDLAEIRNEALPVVKEQADIGRSSAANAVDNIMQNVAPGERHITNERGYELLTRLDAEVNKAYRSLDANSITPEIEAMAKMANALRQTLRQNVPKVGALLSQNHNLMDFESSLLPQISGRPPVNEYGGWVKGAIARTLGSRAGIGVARRLEAVAEPGTLSNKIVELGAKPAAKYGSMSGLSGLIDRMKK